MFHEEENNFVVNKNTRTTNKVNEDYLNEQIQETDPSEVPSNIDEPATFQILDEKPIIRRDTFVGTPLYVSPEMLQESVSLPASDIWALGCIIFKMHTGRNAFNGYTEHQLF